MRVKRARDRVALRAGARAVAAGRGARPRCRAEIAARSSTRACRSTPSASSSRTSTKRRPLFAHQPDRAVQPGVGDEARHDVRGARAARPGLPLEDRTRISTARSTPACCTATSCSRAAAIPRSRSSNGRRSWRCCATRGSRAIDGDLVLDRTFFAPVAHDPARVRRRAAQALQRRARRAARQLQVGASFAFAPERRGRRRRSRRSSPRFARSRSAPPPQLGAGACGDWRGALGATFVDRGTRAEVVVRRPLSRGLRRARLVGVAARPPDVRPRDVRHVLSRGRRPLRGRLEGRRRAARARCRSPRSNRRRCGTSSATSTSCRTTSWRGSSS